ncbi:hypothetical protein E2C01_070899 [Portunus trituberculatus]|uniref:Uncharacterized protein n=1 Tax=Portunus trituberculatus TaxID=210409 RepID=A0A5B7I2W0_PORTR|nr:hypothetical protein [Portunus trituberculatus]
MSSPAQVTRVRVSKAAGGRGRGSNQTGTISCNSHHTLIEVPLGRREGAAGSDEQHKNDT